MTDTPHVCIDCQRRFKTVNGHRQHATALGHAPPFVEEEGALFKKFGPDAPTGVWTVSEGSAWKTRITKVQLVKPARAEDAEVDSGLVLIYPPGPDMGKRFPLDRGSDVVLGRGSDCDVQVDRDSVSRRHARVSYAGDGWMAEDLGSTNGSYINDIPIEKSLLRDGDFLKIGAAIFKFLSGSSIEASYHEEVYRMTIIDALTGAHNKRYLLEFLEREIARCGRYERPLSLVMFDIDHFKSLNDTHGHLTGDYVLKEMAQRLRGRVRKEELLARYGGEEFAVVLPETDLAGAVAVAEEFRRLVADESFELDGDEISVTISLGVSCLDDASMDVSSFIKQADDGLYRAKRSGRNCVVTEAGCTYTSTRALPDLRFRTELERSIKPGTNTQLIAASLLQREALLARHGGGAIVDDLETALTEAARGAAGEVDHLLGRVEGSSSLLVCVEAPEPAVAELSREIAVQFERLRRERRLPEVDLVIRAPVAVREVGEAIEKALAAPVDPNRLANALYPLPLAWALRSLSAQTEQNACMQALIRLHESTVRWLLSLVMASLRAASRSSESVAALRELLERPVPLGRWDGALRTASLELRAMPDPPELSRAMLAELFPGRGKQSPTLDTLHEFIQDRNDFAHRADIEDGRATAKTIRTWRPRLIQLVRELRFLSELEPLSVAEAILPDEDFGELDDAMFTYRVHRLVGDHPVIPATELASRRRLVTGRVYAFHKRSDSALPLDPLVTYQACPECGAMDVFFIDTGRNDELTYASPRNSHEVLPDHPESRRRRTTYRRFFCL